MTRRLTKITLRDPSIENFESQKYYEILFAMGGYFKEEHQFCH